MAGTGTHFDFQANTGQSYTADLIDDLLDTEALPDLTPEYPVNGAGDLQANAPVREPTAEEVCYDVEDTFLDLLSQDRRQDILALTGELPDALSDIDDDTQGEFSSLYTQAVQKNPGLKWYAKFAKLLGPDSFYMDGDQLNIRCPSVLFQKAVGPFIGDFTEDWEDDSPIVKVVRQMASELDSNFTASKKASHARTLQGSKNEEAGQLDIAEIDFSASDQLQDVAGTLPISSNELDIQDDVFGDGVETATIKVSLKDFANKAVAELVEAENLDGDALTARLLDEGFTKARTHEIAAIVKYMRADRATRKSGAAGNRGGDVDFLFGF